MSTIVTKTYTTTCIGALLNNINNNVIITPVCEQILTDGSSSMYFYFASTLTSPENAELDNILATFVCPTYHDTIDNEYLDDMGLGTNVLWSSDKINTELTTNVDHVNLLNKGTNTHSQIDSHISNINNPHQVNDTVLPVLSLGGTQTLNHFIGDTQSAGWIEGGLITDGGSGTLNVASGEGLIRSTNDPTAFLYYAMWPSATGLTIPYGTTRYVYVYYNAGSPQVQLSSVHISDRHRYIYLGEVHNLSGVLKIHNDHRPINDLANRTMLWAESVFGTIVTSGEITYDPTPSSRKLAVTAGVFFDRFFIDYTSSLVDTSTSGTFTQMYRDGAGDWIRTSGQTDVDNLYYDNNTGTLALITGTFYSCRYVIRGFDGNIYVLIGQNQYATLLDAQNEIPPARPEELDEHGFYIAKICIQQGASTFADLTIIKPVVNASSSSSSSSITSHNNLTGLQGGTGNEYYHLTLTQYGQLHINTNDPTTNEKAALVGTYGSPSSSNKYVTDTDPRLGAADSLVKISATDTTSGYLGVKLLAGSNVTFTTNNSGLNESITIAATITNALADPGSNGIVIRTAANVTTARSLVAPSAGISISNVDGVSGNPTFALANDLAALEGLAATGFAVRTGADTWAQRSLVAPSAGISISNVDGVSGNPTFSLTNDLSAVEALTTTGIVKRMAIDTWSAGLVDISAETTGTLPISRGGTGQVTQTTAFNALSPLITKGDIIVRDSTNAVILPVGSNNKILVADSTQSTGVKWGQIPIEQLSNVNPAIAPASGHVLYYDTVNNRWDSIVMFNPTQSRMIFLKYGIIPAFTGTTSIATGDGVSPLITEGTEVWNFTVTPNSVTSKIMVQMSMAFAVSSASARIVAAIFRGNTCIGVMSDTAANNNNPQTVTFSVQDSPNTASSLVYSARVGKSSGSATWYINSLPGYTNPYNGLLQANTYTLVEIT